MNVMRTLLLIPMLTAVTLTGIARGDDRADMLAQFAALEAETMTAMKSGNIQSVEASLGNTKFRLVGQGTIPTQGCLAVKIWGQLVNPDGTLGPYVNLTKHKWQRKERFYMWLQTAVPIQLSFFQNFPEGRPKSKQISPDPAFPDTFSTIMPGAPYKFPVLIEMDDDLRDEQMGIVVVRADSQILPINGGTATATAGTTGASANATTIINGATLPAGSQVSISTFAQSSANVTQTTRAATQPAGGTTTAGASANSLAGVTGPGGTLKSRVAQDTQKAFASIYDAAQNSPATKGRMKLRLVAPPPPQAPPTASPVPGNIDDVSTVLMGPGNIAQIELTLFKD